MERLGIALERLKLTRVEIDPDFNSEGRLGIALERLKHLAASLAKPQEEVGRLGIALERLKHTVRSTRVKISPVWEDIGSRWSV